MILTPRAATWQRWRLLSTTRFSLLRALQYEAIQGLILEGATLDAGGGAAAAYYDLLCVRGPLRSINIDPAMRPTMVADLNQPWPVASASMDNVISFNTFEHLFHDTWAMREMLRVLKPGGRFFIMVPFLYHVHASPSDYTRRTAFWWEKYFAGQGVAPERLRIEPLVWDQLSSAFSLIEFIPLRGLWKRLAMGLGPLLHRRRSHGGWLEPGYGKITADSALGYFIEGRR